MAPFATVLRNVQQCEQNYYMARCTQGNEGGLISNWEVQANKESFWAGVSHLDNIPVFVQIPALEVPVLALFNGTFPALVLSYLWPDSCHIRYLPKSATTARA